MSADVLISSAILVCGIGLVALWLWRIAKLQTPDYDVESFLDSKWQMEALAPLGRTCQSRKRLIGKWRGLYVAVDLCVGRSSLLSLMEEYCIELRRAAPSSSDESTPSQAAAGNATSFRSSGQGDWQVSSRQEGTAVARARFRVPVGQRVLTPTSSKRAMENVLGILKRQLQNG